MGWSSGPERPPEAVGGPIVCDQGDVKLATSVTCAVGWALIRWHLLRSDPHLRESTDAENQVI